MGWGAAGSFTCAHIPACACAAEPCFGCDMLASRSHPLLPARDTPPSPRLTPPGAEGAPGAESPEGHGTPEAEKRGRGGGGEGLKARELLEELPPPRPAAPRARPAARPAARARSRTEPLPRLPPLADKKPSPGPLPPRRAPRGSGPISPWISPPWDFLRPRKTGASPVGGGGSPRLSGNAGAAPRGAGSGRAGPCPGRPSVGAVAAR